MASSQLEVRSDISILRTSYSNHMQEFREIQDQLDLPSPDSVELTQNKDNFDPEYRRALFRRFDGLLATILRLKGFERFLLDPSELDLMLLADNAPIVILNYRKYEATHSLLIHKKSALFDFRELHMPT